MKHLFFGFQRSYTFQITLGVYCIVYASQTMTFTCLSMTFILSCCLSYLEPLSAQRSVSDRILEVFIFNSSERRAIVDAHNKARRTVSPTAQNMRKMTWDNELAEVASQYSKQCLFELSGDPFHSRFHPLGENVFVSTRIPFNPAYATQSVTSWDEEKSDYNFQTSTCDPDRQCRHYTQVVWADTFKVGCGASKCSTINQWRNATILICNYGPAGNLRRVPYEQGVPCSGCHSSDLCENNLCTNPTRDLSVSISSLMPTWSQWGQWTPCSSTCGVDGTRIRTRTCNTTVNADCPGVFRNTEFFCSFHTLCSSTEETTNPIWDAWRGWSACSQSCGSGERTARRICSTGNNRDCSPGRNFRTSQCNQSSCPTWNEWTIWSSCSRSCGGGERTRTRDCSSANDDECAGSGGEGVICGMPECPSILITTSATREGAEAIETTADSNGACIRSYSLSMTPSIFLLMLFTH